jgi:two-component system response regulator YesN
LHALGFDVAGESSGMAGLGRLAIEADRISPVGVLVELDMPVLGGMAIIQEIRDRYPHIPVIAMSNPDRVARLRDALRLGAKEYLVKPFDPELFKRKCLEVFDVGTRLSSHRD